MEQHRYKLGEYLIVELSGSGCSPDDIGQMVKVTRLHGNYNTYDPGYVVHPPIGNCKTGDCGGKIGQSSFRRATKEERRKGLKLQEIEDDVEYCLY